MTTNDARSDHKEESDSCSINGSCSSGWRCSPCLVIWSIYGIAALLYFIFK